MSEKIQTIIDAVKELSVIELSELVKAFEEEFGVSAAAPVAVAAAGGAGDMGVRLWIETPPALHTARCIFACGGRPSGGGSYTAFVAFQRVDTAFDDFAHIRIADSGRLSLF